MKRIFIVNPSAGGGRMGRRLPAVRRRLEKRLGSFDHAVSTGPADVERLTAEALHRGYEQIVALGGDGTLNGVVNGYFEGGKAINPAARVAVSRLGTGTDFQRTIGGDWEALLEDHEVRAVDAGVVECLTLGLRRYYVNCASLGIGADVVRRRAATASALPGLLSYALPALKTLLSYRPHRATITLDGTALEADYFALFVAKGTYAGGGMRIGGSVALDDGRLDVTVVKGTPLGRCLTGFPRLIRGAVHGDERFLKTTARTVEVRAVQPAPAECDGEFLGLTDVRITVERRAVPVCFPRSHHA